MIDTSTYTHNAKLEELVDILCQKTQRKDRKFFRAEMIYFLAKMASSMRVTVNTRDSGKLPLNAYVIALAPSGFGKNKSIGVIKNTFTNEFEKIFETTIFSTIADKSINDYAVANYSSILPNATTPISQAEYVDHLKDIYKDMGVYYPQFDAATAPAIKQYRQKLILAGIAALNLQIDEIGNNLLKSPEVLDIFLELYDEGLTENKLLKSTKESKRELMVQGKTPANMMLFGTPPKLLDGGAVEKEFMSFLESGYARRSFFALADTEDTRSEMSTEDLETLSAEIFNSIVQLNQSPSMNQWSTYFGDMADFANYELSIEMPDDVSIKLTAYRIQSEIMANSISDLELARKADMQHRASKALKIAGILAFLEKQDVVTIERLQEAIKLVEDSSESFAKMLKREENHIKLGKYLRTVSKKDAVTHSQLTEVLPFFKGTPSYRKDLMDLAMEWGSTHGTLIKTIMIGNSLRYYSETLEEADINKCIVSYSQNPAQLYEAAVTPFEKLISTGENDGYFWSNHCYINQHRSDANAKPGFNLIVFDVDGTANRDSVHHILEHYKFITHTTKRHTPDSHRFRVIIPLKYTLRLEQDEYKEFMRTLFAFLPFDCDEANIDRSRRWTMYATPDTYLSNKDADGNDKLVLDPLRFLPSTDNYTAHARQMIDLTQQSLTAIGKWFSAEIKEGNRNHMFYRYGAVLLDAKYSMVDIEAALNQVNDSLPLRKTNPVASLDQQEIRSILSSLANKK